MRTLKQHLEDDFVSGYSTEDYNLQVLDCDERNERDDLVVTFTDKFDKKFVNEVNNDSELEVNEVVDNKVYIRLKMEKLNKIYSDMPKEFKEMVEIMEDALGSRNNN